MKLMWLCNRAPDVVQKKISGSSGSGLWLDSTLQDLRSRGVHIRILCPGPGAAAELDDKCSFATFQEGLPYVYMPQLETFFCKELETFQPDVIHVWGTEYGHTLAMVNAAQSMDMLDHLAVNIQGLVSVIARHYNEGVPYPEQRRNSLRDFLRRDNLLQQQQAFARRGELEVKALAKARHVVGRTHWDRACTQEIHHEVVYHHCDETLRENFYSGEWSYDSCQKHRIFASGSNYPVKGCHYLLEAFSEVLKVYPDAELYLSGRRFPDPKNLMEKMRTTHYQNYLASLVHKYQLEDKVHFYGGLDAEQMKQAFLQANVFVLPSTIENSPNTLCEAMLLGVPCVASDVGGVTTLMEHGKEGFVYASTAPYMLAWYIKQVFAMGDSAAQLGKCARNHALHTHDPQKNRQDLMNIYQRIKK